MEAILNTREKKYIGLAILLFILIIGTLASLKTGQVPTTLNTLKSAILSPDYSNTDHLVIRTTRSSRTLVALLVGSSLAIAGAYMQALTRNPLASPSLFGINAGALFFVVLGTVFFSVNQLGTLMAFAFIGAGLGAIFVFILGSMGQDSLSPLRLVLAGAAITAFFSSFTQGMLVIDEQSLEGVLFWLGGSVSGRSLDLVLPIAPFVLLTGCLAFFLSDSVNVLSTGEDIARGLGQNVAAVKFTMSLIIVVLAGSSVAIAGSIGFIGLVVPHLVRYFTGHNHRWIVPYCGLLGAIILLYADLIARLVIMPEEMPIGVMTALIGAPYFIYTARKGDHRANA
tara:strand:- start:247 stop:1266 length:1020 start_codon:yes stop_codon:yes gene_type:complete